MPYTPILATLGYILSDDRQRVLLIHRDRRPDDNHFGSTTGSAASSSPARTSSPA